MKYPKTKRCLLFMMLLMLPALSYAAGNVDVSDKLNSLSSQEAKLLLTEKLRYLDDWSSRESEKNNSSKAYIFENTLVKDLYWHPYKYSNLSNSVINDKEIGDDEKKWLVRLSQCLLLEDYLILGDHVLKSVINGNSGEEVLVTVISPGPLWGGPLDLNHKSPEVRQFLQQVVEDIPHLNQHVEPVLSGVTADFITTHNRAGEPYGERYPALSCL